MYKCGGCNGTYYSKTKQYFKVRICEHFGISHLTGKKVKISNNKLTVILEHPLCCNYSSSFEHFSILASESKDFKLKIMESFVITCDEPVRTPVQACSVYNHHVSSDHMFHHIIWCSSIPLHGCNCCLFGFQYYVSSFSIYQKQNIWVFKTILGMTMKAVAFES